MGILLIAFLFPDGNEKSKIGKWSYYIIDNQAFNEFCIARRCPILARLRQLNRKDAEAQRLLVCLRSNRNAEAFIDPKGVFVYTRGIASLHQVDRYDTTCQRTVYAL